MSRRGFVEEDSRWFVGEQLERLYKAAVEMKFLLDRGYPTKGASVFVGNHYLFSERQRLALMRVVSSSTDVSERNRKLVSEYETVEEVFIDGFNSIITLEVALSGAPVFLCDDHTVRDLAGLRGTYRIIEQTSIALKLMFDWLDRKGIKRASVYLDAPVSNSGRLKGLIMEFSADYLVEVNVFVMNEVDQTLEKLPNVISSDSIILNRCQSFINMNREILMELDQQKVWWVDLLVHFSKGQ